MPLCRRRLRRHFPGLAWDRSEAMINAEEALRDYALEAERDEDAIVPSP